MRNRQAMQALLARARARLDPTELGLAPRTDPRGRRAQGLTHEHMTRLLGWPDHKYGYVERGRLAHIGTDELAPIARILHLSEHEWEAVVLYATGLLPAHPLDPRPPGAPVPAQWERVLRTSGEMAYISDIAWDVIAYNTAFARMYPERRVPPNTMRWMLLSPEARHILGDWEHSWLPLIVPQLRNAVSAYPRHRTLARLAADARRDPVVAAAFASASQEFLGPRVDEPRPLMHTELGPGWATMCPAGPFGVPGARLMFVLFDAGEHRPAASPSLRAPAPGPVDPEGPAAQATA
ncbi:MmyB family transcriptional regulator [Actinacidiphila rubida]|uniref:MmyB-like transcription regulator ligand binding domain-containing protein n=1 Tax=Actinacidiphila rubida TaxID=310780 RepID=A0A1H8Q700_9ACTN|nr:helix-turn-helix domain-containing protein [Actinacidiphila rubida]SEO50015.1 hypothetical protein SAMN05216267_102885 [Actinacidiphila rubida]